MRVAIIGCGYVGLRLGELLHGRTETVVGIRRSENAIESMESRGLQAIRGDIREKRTLNEIPDVDVIVVTANPSSTDTESATDYYRTIFQRISSHFERRPTPPTRLIYTSSTGIYGDHAGAWVDEKTEVKPVSDRERSIDAAEEFAFSTGFETTVIRLAGIYGPGKYRIERYLSGPVTEGILNMVHRDDAAGMIAYLLETEQGEGEIILGVDNEPVGKWEFADWLAQRFDNEKPKKITVEERLADGDYSESKKSRIRSSKRCSNTKLRKMGYTFRFPTFRDGYRPVISQRSRCHKL